MDDPPSRERARTAFERAATLLGLAALYFLAGKLGLRLAFVHASATAVWPPTGIALAAFLLLGSRVWPAVLAGAFLVNATTEGTLLTSAGIATGNTLEGLAGAWLVDRFAGGRHTLERPRDVLRFTVLAGLVATTVSPTVGVASLTLGGFARPNDFAWIWVTWWLGDVGGALVVAPLLLTWATLPLPRWDRRRAVEAGMLGLTTLIVGLETFGGLSPVGTRELPLQFLVLPPLLWGAFRFSRREVVSSTVLLSAIALWGSLRGVGPYSRLSPNEALLMLQTFMGVTSVTMLAVSAAVSERRGAEEALARAAAVVESSDHAIFGKTLDGTIVSWNAGAARLYGYAPGEIIGRNISTLLPKGALDDTRDILAKIRLGEGVDLYETVRTGKDGRSRVISLTVSPIRNRAGTIVGASTIARDITERERARHRLALQSAVTRILSEGLSLRDCGPQILSSLCDHLGWEAGELWLRGAGAGILHREARWPRPPPEEASREAALPRGSDVAGHAWEAGGPLWVEDMASDRRFPRSSAAVEGGFRSALADPIRTDGTVKGVLALYGRAPRLRDDSVLESLSEIDSRIGQFLERQDALEDLRRLKKAVETLEMGVTITDTAGRILYTNPAEATLHGYTPADLVGRHVSVFMPQAWTPASGRPNEVRSWRRETVNIRKDGTIFPVQLLSDSIASPDGTPVAIVTCCEEITERKRAEQALRSSESRYRLLFERNLAGVYRTTLDGRILECNDAFARILGYASRDEVLSVTAWDFFFERSDREASLARLRETGALSNFELRMRRQDGSRVWVLENQTLFTGEDGTALVEGTLIDITDRKLIEERVEFQAYHDPLTELPNRIYLRDRLHLALAQARRSGRGLALMFLDVDHFKAVNDTLGHAVGDQLLQEIARRLKEGLREDDTVARVGGDEFILLLPRIRRAEGAARVARKLLARIEEPIHFNGHELAVTASAGIALYPQDGEDAESLLKNADSAMYRAKELGRNGFQLCDLATERMVRERMALQNDLRHALDRGQMSVVYQPLLDLRSGRIVAMEALLRWQHPDRGQVEPSEFIPLAEEIGFISRLGEWALRSACTQASAWHPQGRPALRVAVNLSAGQLRRPNFTATIARILRETGLPPPRLDLEVTETTAMQNLELTVPVLRALAEMGIGVSIDDFGTGYSSLSYLKMLPVRCLKIDRSFIAGLEEEPRDTTIIKAIVRMAHSLGLRVVAEGVETEAQVGTLRQLRCDEIQGWIVSRPIPWEALERLLAAEAS